MDSFGPIFSMAKEPGWTLVCLLQSHFLRDFCNHFFVIKIENPNKRLQRIARRAKLEPTSLARGL